MISDVKQLKMKTIIKISFKNLKQNYVEVQQFLQKESGEKNIYNKSKVANDLSLWGDDNYDMLEKFITKYKVDFSNFNYDKHFESEGELLGFYSSIFTIFFLPLFILKFIWFSLSEKTLAILSEFSRSCFKTTTSVVGVFGMICL